MTLFQLASYIYHYKKKFRGGSKFDTLLQMKRNYCSNQATSKNAFLGAGYPSPALKMISNFILEIYLIQKNNTADGPALVGGLPAGSHVRTSL